MFARVITSVLFICYLAVPALADTTIEYTTTNGWTYEEEEGVSGTLTVTDNPSGGVTVSIEVPSPGGSDEGGLAASKHDLPGFSIDRNMFIELQYGSLNPGISGETPSVDTCIELQFLDSSEMEWEIAMSLDRSEGSWSFGTWYQNDPETVDNEDETPVPGGLTVTEGALGLYFHGNYVTPYFRDTDNNIIYPFADWDISQISGAYNFAVDNDFEADTEGGGTVDGEVNFIQVLYGNGSPQGISIAPLIILLNS